MFKNLLKKVVGDPNKKLLDSLRPIVDAIAAEEPELAQMSDDQLRGITADLQARSQNGEDVDDMLIEAFALVREASKRTIGLRHYDVQMMGGILLHRGEIVEMRTGEGKTLVGTCPLFLNAITGKGVHLVTVNDYLARRDGGWMGNIFNFLGLTVGCIGPQRFSAIFDPDFVNPGAELEDDRLVHWRPSTRQESYKADVTYGTSSEFGFDYLRDNLAKKQEELSQRPLHFAVIDEVDNVLIDEARTPLIISGPANQSGSEYKYFAAYVRGLKKNTAEDDETPNGHFDIDEKSRSISLTEIGIVEIEKRIEDIDHEAGESLWDPKYFHLTYYLDNALKAQYMFNRDKEYVIQEGKIVIVDDFTGRLMPGRRYSDGLHEAIEAKENVVIQRENITVATVTIQNYFRIYDKLSGMTGTAMTDAEEFSEIYEVEVTPLPTNVQYIFDTGSMDLTEKKRKLENADEIYYVQPGAENDPVFYKRTDFPDQVYGTEVAKDDAILAEVERMVEIGRPVLVGTTSVEHSEMIHKTLKSRKIGHQVLNAKQHQSEALIVAQAGRQQSVTISTNMAGRGTDILLGGNPEGMSAEALEQALFDRNTLNNLALKLIQDGEQAARKQANSHSKLDESLVDALIESKASFDGSLKEIEQLQLGGFVARRLTESFGCDFNEASQIVRLAQARTLSRAREHALSLNLDTTIVEDANSQLELFGGYESASKDSKKSADFLAHLLFEKHYNGRAALVSLVLDGEVEEAHVICNTVPAMPDSLITLIQDIIADTKQERDIVMKLGGLHVIGSERHESRRIDNQLRGRAARQGDPGSSRFFLSLEDDLMVRFGGNRLQSFMTRTNIPDDMPIEAGMLDRIIQSSQERLEGFNFDGRKNVVEYDDVMNKQRVTIYGQRRAILMGESDDVDEQVEASFEINLRRLVDNYLSTYPDYMRGEMAQVVDTMTTQATDTINVRGVMTSLRSLLPGLNDVDPDTLESERPDKLVDQLMHHVYVNEDDGTNLLQLINAMGAFLPLLPPVPNLGLELGSRRSDHLAARETIRLRFLTHVKNLYNEFIGAQVNEGEREQIWGRTADNINQAFNQFSVSGMNVESMKQQQPAFKRRVDEALRDMLVGSMEALDGDQLVSATLTHVNAQQEVWRDKIGEEEFANFQRLLMLSAIDREWRDYLTAMDDLRREIGLESVAQRDPKVEYKRRSYEMFTDMRGNIDDAIVENYFRQLQRHQQFMEQQKEEERRMDKIIQGGYTVNGGGAGGRVQRTSDSVGRNDPCPCGSGQKYKNCHLKSDKQGQAATRQAAAPTRPANSGSTTMRSKNKHKKKKKKRK